jgi:hypothetical protein
MPTGPYASNERGNWCPAIAQQPSRRIILQVFQAQARQHQRPARPLDDRDTVAVVERLAARDKRIVLAKCVQDLGEGQSAGGKREDRYASLPCDGRSLGR